MHAYSDSTAFCNCVHSYSTLRQQWTNIKNGMNATDSEITVCMHAFSFLCVKLKLVLFSSEATVDKQRVYYAYIYICTACMVHENYNTPS